MVEASTAPRVVSKPVNQTLYYVRLIDPWRLTASAQPRWSFFGLELQLQGLSSINGGEQVTVVLDFTRATRAQQRDGLREVVGPFTVVVQSKMPLDNATDQQKYLLQLFVPVQIHNTLARINKVHFLKHCSTGADVYKALELVVDTASVAKPFELTFLRHNHTEAAAKIRPFASRGDVQKAQVAQFQKLQEEESKWPEDRKRRKQFVLQQMDYYREHYLFDHIGAQLQSLHEEIMGGGQWHAYEFEKTLWYYHATSGHLYAEHPMRTNEKTRQLIGGVQLRTRIAARQLQHGARRFLQLNRMLRITYERLADELTDEIIETSFSTAWEARVAGTYVDQLKSNISTVAKMKLWGKRTAIAGEPTPPNSSDAERQEEILINEAVERLLDKSCDEQLVNITHDAWKTIIAETYVDHLKTNATISAKVKRRWKNWARQATAAAKAEQAETKLTNEAIGRVLDIITDEILASSAQRALTTMRTEREEKLANEATQQAFDNVFNELLEAAIKSAWDVSVADLYVGHLKANATKTAKAKRLWEKWTPHAAALSKAEAQAAALRVRSQAEEKLADVGADRLLNVMCDEILRLCTQGAWEASPVRLWEKWTAPGAAIRSLDKAPVPPVPSPVSEKPLVVDRASSPVTKPTRLVDRCTSPVVPQERPRLVDRATSTVAILEKPRMVDRGSSPVVHQLSLVVNPVELSSPEVADVELVAVTANTAIAVTPELPAITRSVSIEPTRRQDDVDKYPNNHDDNDGDDNHEIRNWRSRLRLLKHHQRTRRRKSPTARRSNVVAPRALAGPMLLDRSPLLLDLAVDGLPYAAVPSTLRDAHQTRYTTSLPDHDDAFFAVDDETLTNASVAHARWRSDGSFRSFHEFFNSATFPHAAAHYRSDNPPRQPHTTTSRLPTVGIHSSAVARSPPPPAAVGPFATASSPPQKLPYIRRRKPVQR